MKYEVRLSSRAQRDFGRLDKPTQRRVVQRLDKLAADPYDPRISAPLKGVGNLRKSRLGGWRLIYEILDETRVVLVAMIDRRGQVYKRI